MNLRCYRNLRFVRKSDRFTGKRVWLISSLLTVVCLIILLDSAAAIFLTNRCIDEFKKV